jgi:hypothetical protein
MTPELSTQTQLRPEEKIRFLFEQAQYVSELASQKGDYTLAFLTAITADTLSWVLGNPTPSTETLVTRLKQIDLEAKGGEGK